MFRRWRWWRFILGVMIVLAATAAVIWRMTQLPPAWYAPPSVSNEETVALAEEVEYRLLEQVQKFRGSAEPSWTRRVRQEQINAWLATRLRPWIEHERGDQWPAELGTPQVRVQEGRITLALPITDGGTVRMIVAGLIPEITDRGLTLRLVEVSLGRLTLPGDPLVALAGRLSHLAAEGGNNPRLDEALEVLSGRRAIDPVFELADGRQVRLVSLRPHEGFIDIEMRTSEVD